MLRCSLIAVLLLVVSVPISVRADAGDDPVVSGKKLSEWIADLKSKDQGKLMVALDAIGKGGAKSKAAVPAILEAMKAGGAAEYYGGNALKKIGPDALAALLEVVKGKDAALSESATRLLRRDFPEDAKKAGLGSIADELAEMKKLEVTTDLRNTSWYFVGGTKAGSKTIAGMPEGSRLSSMTFGSDSVEWKPLRTWIDKAGKGTFSIDGDKKPARIEIKVGNETYKGIYDVFKVNDKLVRMNIQMNEAGADYPTEFWKKFNIPADAKFTTINFVRVK
jgi:hypothetical protein